MVELYKKYQKVQDLPDMTNRHLMPLSLRYIKILSEAGIDWKGLHIIDAFSLVCSINISAGRRYLSEKARQRQVRAGVKRIAPASAADFEAL